MNNLLRKLTAVGSKERCLHQASSRFGELSIKEFRPKIRGGQEEDVLIQSLHVMVLRRILHSWPFPFCNTQ